MGLNVRRLTPSPRRGEGWGVGAPAVPSCTAEHPHPTSPSALQAQGYVSFPLQGEGKAVR